MANLLDNLQFPSLQLFKMNLPHHHPIPFLSSHKSITDLCIDSCRRGADEICPLGMLDLSHTSTVECPVGCVPAVMHSQLLCLTAQSQRHSPNTTTILQSLLTPLPRLFALTLDIFLDDYDILWSIIVCVPRVVRLKLLEWLRTSQVSCFA